MFSSRNELRLRLRLKLILMLRHRLRFRLRLRLRLRPRLKSSGSGTGSKAQAQAQAQAQALRLRLRLKLRLRLRLRLRLKLWLRLRLRPRPPKKGGSAQKGYGLGKYNNSYGSVPPDCSGYTGEAVLLQGAALPSQLYLAWPDTGESNLRVASARVRDPARALEFRV